jgi:hypothetical protein
MPDNTEGDWTAVAEIKDWSLQVSRDLIDTSILSDSADQRGWKKAFPGMRGWTGSMTVHWNMQASGGNVQQTTIQNLLIADDPAEGPTKLGVRLLVDNVNKIGYQGFVYVKDMSIKVSVTGVVEATINFTGTAKLYKWPSA